MRKKPMATKHPIDNRPIRKPMATRRSDSTLLILSLLLFLGTIPILAGWV